MATEFDRLRDLSPGSIGILMQCSLFACRISSGIPQLSAPNMTKSSIPNLTSVYTDVRFGMDDFVMFGAESCGIPEEILHANREHCIRIPMLPGERSLNLSNSVAIVLYEMLRQNHFEGLLEFGELHRLHW